MMLLDHLDPLAPPVAARPAAKSQTTPVSPQPTPQRSRSARFPTVIAAQTRSPSLALRVWVAGDLPGVNHSQRGMGKGRHLTEKAQAWAQRVEQAMLEGLASRRMRRDLWQPLNTPSVSPPAANLPGHLGVRLHFYVVGKRLKNGSIRKLDVDAPSKLTLDHLVAALGVDDAHVRVLEVAQTILENDLPRVGGYGKTRQGAWVDVWRLTPAEQRRLDDEQPGAPG